MTSNIKKRKLTTPSGLGEKAVQDISAAMNGILADVFALYLKTKNFHWHLSGPHFHDYHLMFDEQAGELFSMIDAIAERIRKVGGTTLRSIGHIQRTQRILDNDADFVEAGDMLAELFEDNQSITHRLRQAHVVTSTYHDYATTSMLEEWLDQAERRTWFLFEAHQHQDSTGH